jgi:ribonuclease G
MVQVIKDPIGTKGARLSTQISIAGRCWCFCRRTTTSACRRRSPDQRDELRKRLQALAPSEGGGFILRTNGEDATDAELAEDIAYLRKTWARIKEAACACRPVAAAPGPDLLQRVLRDLVGEDTQTIRHRFARAVRAPAGFGQEFMPGGSGQAAALQGRAADLRPVFDRRGNRRRWAGGWT